MKLIHDSNRTSQFLFLAKKPASINNSKTQSTRKFYESKIKRSKDQEAHQHNIVNKSKHTEKKKNSITINKTVSVEYKTRNKGLGQV